MRDKESGKDALGQVTLEQIVEDAVGHWGDSGSYSECDGKLLEVLEERNVGSNVLFFFFHLFYLFIFGCIGSSLQRAGLVALRHVGSSWTRARTRVPCIGRRILNHCATREAPNVLLKGPLWYVENRLSWGELMGSEKVQARQNYSRYCSLYLGEM